MPWCPASRAARRCHLRGLRRGQLARAAAHRGLASCSRYLQQPNFSLDRPDMPFAKRELFDKRNFLTQAVFEATLVRARL